MAALLILSIDTGDSRILSGTREAATTTSSPRVKEVANSTEIISLLVFTTTSLLAYPTEEKTKVIGSFITVENLKFPLSSVKVPVELPFTVTDTAEIASLDLPFDTLPATVVDC